MGATRKRSPNVAGSVKENANGKTATAVSDEETGPSVWTLLTDIDETYTKALAVCAGPESSLSLLRPVMKVLEISCHGIPWLLGALVLLLSVHKAQDVEILLNLLTALVLDLVVIGTLKIVFRRTRPSHNQMDMFATVSIDNYSFPSGHSSRAAMLLCFFVQNIVTTKFSAGLMMLWSLVVSLSRVMLGRHHLVDVICGLLVGILEYGIVLYLWIPRDTSLQLLELYFSHFHL